MKHHFSPLVLWSGFALLPLTALAVSDATSERVGASFLLGLGRTPSAAELKEWQQPGEASLTDLVARHRQQLQRDPARARAVAVQAVQDAFGRTPADRELAAGSAGDPTYTALMLQHLQRLGGDPAGYQQVIQRAYQRVLRREPYEVEFEYWKDRPTLSYVLLVGAVENWALRNAPGLMATTGAVTVSVNSNLLTTLRLSPAVATEARVATGLGVAAGADVYAATGRTVVAPGAADVVSVGRIHFAVAGAADLVAKPSPN